MRESRRWPATRGRLRDIAVSMLHPVALLVLHELGLVVISTLRSSTLGVGQGQFADLESHCLGLSVYRDHPWAGGYWSEVRALVDMPYRPFLVWR